MCIPIAVVGVIASVAATAVSYQSSQNQAKFAEDTAKYNARVAENDAEKQRTLGVEEENKQRRETAEAVSRQRAQLGANGVEIDQGSALQLQTDTATLGEVDALRIRQNFNDGANALDTSASLTQLQGANQAQASRNQATSTLITAGAGVASKWFTPNSAANAAPIRNAVAS